MRRRAPPPFACTDRRPLPFWPILKICGRPATRTTTTPPTTTTTTPQTTAVDAEIFEAVRSQGGAGSRTRQELGQAHGQVSELFARLRSIQQQASDSESMVAEICRDIRKLDTAKKHLATAIGTLKAMANLQRAVAELEGVAHRRDQYRAAAQMLEVIGALRGHFSQYEAVPKVRALLDRVRGLESSMVDSVMDDFRTLLGTADVRLAPDALDRLSAACLVINALDAQVKVPTNGNCILILRGWSGTVCVCNLCVSVLCLCW